MMKSIENVEIDWIFDIYFHHFRTIFGLIDGISNKSIEIGFDLINFAATIDLDSKNSDRNLDLNMIQIWNFSKFGSGSIESPMVSLFALISSNYHSLYMFVFVSKVKNFQTGR